MAKSEEKEYSEIIKRAHKSVPGGCQFNTGRLLIVLKKNLIPIKVSPKEDDEPIGRFIDEENLILKKKTGRSKINLDGSTNTLSTDSDSTTSPVPSSIYSSASTSYADSWE